MLHNHSAAEGMKMHTSRFIPLLFCDVCGCPPAAAAAFSTDSGPSGTLVARAGCAVWGRGEESLVVGATVAAFAISDLRGGIVVL